MFIALIVVASVFLCVKCRDVSDKHFRRIVFISWIVIVVLEIYKQLVFSVEYTEGAFVWDYQWYAFPFQFCSSPLYALPFVALMPDGKLRDAFIGFVAFFSLFAGVAVFIYPNDVFIDTIGTNVQTMIHHCTQIVLGVFSAIYPAVPYIVFFLIYCIGFSIAALAIFSLFYLPIHLISRRKNA